MEGIKRIKKMAVGQKDFVLLEIVKYLTSRTDMDQKYLNPEKTLKGMALYIHNELLKDFCKKMNIEKPEMMAKNTINNIRYLQVNLSEEATYALAINYFEKSNKELGVDVEKNNIKVENELKKVKEIKDEFGSIFGVIEKDADTSTNDKEEIEQISFF